MALIPQKNEPSEVLNRRQFLGSSARNAAQAAAGAVVLGNVAVSSAKAKTAGPSEQVRLGVVGLRNQGKTLIQNLLQLPSARIVALCDIDSQLLDRAADLFPAANQAPAPVQHYQELLDRNDLDAVVIATPDHHHAWMTALACAAGKDVYLEIPVTHTGEEARQLERMIDQSGAIVQCGLQHRSGEHYRNAIQFLHSGQLGKVHLTKAWACVKRQKLAPHRQSATLDRFQEKFCQAWLNHLSPPPISAENWHFHWQWFWQFGSGELGAWGVELLDLARWGMQVAMPDQVFATGGKFHFDDARETPDTMNVQFQFGNKTILWEHRQWSNRGLEGRAQGVAFYGERGTLVIDRSGWKVYDHAANISQPTSPAMLAHLDQFLQAVRTRQQPYAPFSEGRISTELVHQANAVYRQSVAAE